MKIHKAFIIFVAVVTTSATCYANGYYNPSYQTHYYQNETSRAGFQSTAPRVRSVSETVGNTTYETYYKPETRNGFSSFTPTHTSKTETVGDTTYHTYYPVSNRAGFR